MKQKNILASFRLAILMGLMLGLTSSAGAFVWEDFEQSDAPWYTNKFGGSRLMEGQVSTDFASSGKASFRGTFALPEKGGRLALTTLQGGDMTGLTAIVFDIYNSSALDFEGFFVYKSGPDWKWHESTRFKLNPGWNKDVTIAVGQAGPASIQAEFLDNMREFNFVLDAHQAGEGYVYMDNIRLEGPDAARFAAAKADEQVKGQSVLLAGFEGLNSVFGADSWSGSSSTGIEKVEVKTTEGSKAGRFLFDSKVPDDKPSYTLEGDLDLTGVAGIQYDVYNPLPDDVEVAIAVSTGEWVYHESIMKTLKPGWNMNVTFPIRSKNYKCATTNWANSAAIANLSHARKISLLFMPHIVGSGYFLVDRVRFVADDAKKMAAQLRDAGIEEVPVPEGSDKLLEGFEEEERWTADTSFSGAVSAMVVQGKTTEGSKLLEGTFDIGGSRKNAFFCLEAKMDLGGVKALKVDIYNPQSEPLQSELAVIIGEQYVWYESRLVDLKPGWNIDVTFPLNTASYKTAATQWKNKAVPGPLEKVKKIQLGVYSNNPLTGKVFFDNVRVVAPQSFQFKTVKTKPRKAVTGREVVFDPLMSAAGGWQANQLASDDSYAVAVLYGRHEGVYGVNLKYRTATEQQKASFYKEAQYDWTSVTGVRFDVYNPQDHAVEVSLAVQTGSNFTWHESERLMVKPGWNHDLTFSVADPVWKSAQSNWTNTDNLAAANDVRRVNLLVYPNRREEGKLFLSRVRTLERDLFGTLGQKSLGKMLGVSARGSMKVMSVKSGLLTSFDEGIATPPSEFRGVYHSQGSKSVKVPFIKIASASNTDIGVALPEGKRDLRPYRAMMFDFYNPGPPQSLSVGFKASDAAGTWFSSTASVTLGTGWNRDVLIPLTGPTFKSSGTAWKPGATLGIAADVAEIHFQLSSPPGRSALYLDNLRMVGNAMPYRASVTATEDLLFKLNPTEAVQLIVGGSVWKNDKTRAGADLTKVQLDVRGLNQEFRASVGTALPTLDDPMKLVDASVLGSSLFALSERATVKNTSLNLFGFARTGDRPMELGSDAGWGARLTQSIFNDYSVGVGILDHRFGNRPGSSPFAAEVESDIKTIHADAKGYVRKASLNFEAEVGQSQYEEYEGASYGYPNDNNKAYHFLVTWSHGPLKISAGREEKERGFYSPYSTQNSTGYYQNKAEVSYQLDTLKPIKALRQKGGFFGDLVENLKTYTQYYDWHVRTDTYKNYGVRTVVETNDYKTPLYLKAWFYWYDEGKDAGDATLDNPALSTHEKEFTQNLEARYRLRPNFYLNTLCRLSSSKYWEATTGSAGLKLRFWGDTSLGGDLKYVKMVGSRWGEYANLNASLVKRIRTALVEYEVGASYGTPSFSGYWMDDVNLKTIPMWTLTLTGRF